MFVEATELRRGHPAGGVPVDPTPPPWRVLDAPSASPTTPTGAPTSRAPAASSERAGPAWGVVGAITGTIACVGLAFVLAMTSGGAAEVVVDGGTVLPAASDGSVVGGVGAEPPDGAASGELVVEIVGAVTHPGVFRLAPGARVGDLIAAAGGYGPRVDTVRAAQELNLAAPLRDGDQVRVPSRDDLMVGTGSGGPTAEGGDAAGSGPLDLNTATAEQLEALPGIGPVTVEKILAAREEAPFASIEELRTRGLVGEKTFERIRDAVTAR